MKKDEIMKKLNKVFRDVFDDESVTVAESTTAQDINGWDSYMHITLFSEIEDEFDVEFEMQDVTKMKNVGEIVDKIAESIDKMNID